MTKLKESTKKPKFTMLGLLGALSYWGTTARLLLVGGLIVFAYLVNVSIAGTSWQLVDQETMFMVYGLSTIVILDTGYVMTARALTLDRRIDRVTILSLDFLVASLFVLPSVISVGVYGERMRLLSLFVVLLIISVRILLGLLLTKKRK